jgi:hypothetical protein
MDAATWSCVPSDIKEMILRACFADDSVVMTDDIFLNMLRVSREQAPEIHSRVVEAIDPYLPIEKECASIDWEEFLKRMTVSSIMEFLHEHKVEMSLSSEEKRSKRKLIECVASTLKRDPVTLLRQKRVDAIERDTSFCKHFVEDDAVDKEMQIMRDSLVAKYKRWGSSEKGDLTSVNEKVDSLFGKTPRKSLHPEFLQRL